MDNKSNKKRKEVEEISRDQFTVVLEKINSKIDLLVEGHQILDGKIDQLKGDFESFKSDTENNFRSLADYLSRIEAEVHGELKTKASIKELATLEKRVERLEQNWRLQSLSGAKA